jgi:hypothetical protein
LCPFAVFYGYVAYVVAVHLIIAILEDFIKKNLATLLAANFKFRGKKWLPVRIPFGE